jgi:hypothetical protein
MFSCFFGWVYFLPKKAGGVECRVHCIRHGVWSSCVVARMLVDCVIFNLKKKEVMMMMMALSLSLSLSLAYRGKLLFVLPSTSLFIHWF